MSTSFIHLHVHSEYSLVDGLIRLPELVEATAKMGGFAVALTDQCNLFGVIKFYKAAEKSGLKPIVGTEFWVNNDENQTAHPPTRLILLCQNWTGYRNLMELISLTYMKGQVRHKPCLEKQWLQEKNEGLLAIIPDQESDLNTAILQENMPQAKHLLEAWLKIFSNRLYMEITRIHQPKEQECCQALVLLSEATGVPLVATNNVRFLKREDFEAHEARVCIHEGYTLNDGGRIKQFTEEQYLKSPEEMQALFNDIPEALENSVEIAKRCNLELNLGQAFLPDYPVPDDYTVEEYLNLQAHEGLKSRFKHLPTLPQQYIERLDMELSVINSMHFAGYFLIVADFIRWAKNQNIPVGPGRGSGAGSLVAYVLEITGLDPIKHELLFERFLNPERVSMPDFDIDFCMEGRDRVIDYVTQTYGREAVSQIITFGTMAARAVIRDVGRVLGYTYGFVDRIAKLVPHTLGVTLEKALIEEELLRKAYEEEDEIKTLIDLAMKLEGITRNVSKHAGGVVIAPSKLTDYVPLYCDSEEGIIITQFDKNDVEEIGLVKFDFLGLRTLTIIQAALDTINHDRVSKGESLIDINTLPMDDLKTFELLKTCQTTAVFQLESRGMRDLVRRLKPDIFEEIVALVALFRPGPLQSGLVDDFINRKHGRATPEYLHPSLVNLLKPTYGIILYQEQVTQIAQILAGYSLGSADLLRKAMGKKKPEEMAKQREIFVKGAVLRGVDAHTAEYIFGLMEKFAGYGFNRSHAAAYALLTYQTAWLKTHFPAPFMAAVLSCDMAHTDKVVLFIEDCRLFKLKVHPPRVNESGYKFTVKEDNSILYGLGAIKGVGEAAISNILECRANKPFQNLFDFCARIDQRKVTRRVVEALIKSGAFDSFGEHRALLMETLEQAISSGEKQMKNLERGQKDLFGDLFSSEDILPLRASKIDPWPRSVLLEGEKETLGFYFSGHPLEEFEAELKTLITSTIHDLNLSKAKRYILAGLIVNIRIIFTKKGDRMAFFTLDDNTGRQEVAIFSDLFKEKRDLLQKDKLVVVEGEISIDDYSGGYKMRADALMDLNDARVNSAKCLKLTIVAEAMSDNFTQQLQQILNPFRGGRCHVKIVYVKPSMSSEMSLSEAWKVHPREPLLEALQSLCGKEAVELSY